VAKVWEFGFHDYDGDLWAGSRMGFGFEYEIGNRWMMFAIGGLKRRGWIWVTMKSLWSDGIWVLVAHGWN
jgi:hypothetical protein